MAAPQTEVLITVDGLERGRYLFAPGDYVIGREEGCHIRVEAELVSRRHAKLVLNYDHAVIEDLGSSNGTRVNGQPIAKGDATRLWPNQKIQVGTATIELRRLKVEVSDQSLMPAQSVVKRVLPEEFLREKKYDIGKVVAQGGMGAILDAKEATIERTVAMKVMLDAADADALARFLNEAKITGQLEHPNIVPVHELSVDENGQPFYTMKMVRGVTLKKVLERMAAGESAQCLVLSDQSSVPGAQISDSDTQRDTNHFALNTEHYSLPALLTIFQKVCDALAFAHSKGIIHRDLKPENIMLDDFGVVLVMDWGLAKRMKQDGSRMPDDAAVPDEDIRTIRHTVAAEMAVSATFDPATMASTLAGTVMGTPQFMSPEQARGEVATLDARSDIYSLGAILYQILALRVPVTGKDAWDIIAKVARGEIEPIVAQAFQPVSPGHPQAGKPVLHSLAAVVRKAMALDRAARYATVADLQRDLEAYQTGFATSAENAGAWKQFTLFVRRHKAASLGVAAVLLTGSVLGTKAILEGKRAERGEVRANAEAVRAGNEATRANHTLAELKKTAPTLLALAESEAGFQRFDSALVKLDAALALDPALTAGWWRRAWLLVGMARYGEAPAAFRTAQQRDPAQHAHDALLPVLDAIAAAPDDATRFPPERTEALFRHFTKVGASGELNALSQRLTLGAEQKKQMVRKRLDEWLGKNVGVVVVQPSGSIHVTTLPNAIATLEPLRGLPIASIEVSDTAVKSLEPLRGMALTYLKISSTRISDLSPLRGMPITELSANASDISDLTPLAGMPLRKFFAPQTKISDISPLRGAPLEEFHVISNRIVDFSPLRGAPLKRVFVASSQCSDLSFLTDSPALEHLECYGNSIADLTPLRGKPLKFLNAERNPITDLRPLAGLPLTELSIVYNPIADYAPLRELRQLQKLRISALSQIKVSLEPLRRHPSLQYIALVGVGPYRPVAEFWADYDAQQAAGKK